MKESIFLSISGLLFALLLLILYYIKSKQTKINNKIFKMALIVLMLTIVSEIGAIFILNNFPNNIMLGKIVTRVNIILTMIWVMIICSYVLTIGKGHKIDSLINLYFKDKKIFPLTMALIVFIILSMLLDVSNVVTKDYSYMSGRAMTALYIWGFTSVALTIVSVIIKNEDLGEINKTPLIFAIIETVISMVIQLKYPMYLIITESFVVKMYLLYFMFENPDLILIKELEESKKNIDRSNRAKTDFLSNMSHDIRTPVNAIMSFSEGINNDDNIDLNRAIQDMRNINTTGKNLLEIINNILDISKIESGEEKLDLKEYDVKELILEIKNIADVRIGDKNVSLVMNIDESTPRKVLGDKTKLFQIMLNILSNSVKYTEVGKVVVTLKVSLLRDNKALFHFEVSDTGFGIKPEDYDKMFEKFSRLDNAVKNEIEGTGLGLVIAKNLTNLMDGKIWFDSVYGAGTNFYLEVPQTIVDKTPIGDIDLNNDVHEKNEYLDLSGYSVLLVDDNSLNLKVIEKLLKPYNLNITKVDNGKECIDKIKSGNKYNIIFMDHMMPEMDGIETVKILRKLKGYDLPIIVAMTANAIVGAREMYLENGFDDYISKPVSIKELDNLIRRVLNK